MRILLVEDEEDVRSFLARALRHVAPGVTVLTASDGLDALGVLSRETVDLIISDHRMPRMTGLELLRTVRAGSSTPFVIITADRSIELDAFATGVSELLSKPISLDTLRAVVRQMLP